MTINEWLHWYKLYRNPEPDDDDVDRLTGMGRALLGTLKRVFPFKVKVGRYSWRSMGATRRCIPYCMPPKPWSGWEGVRMCHAR